MNAGVNATRCARQRAAMRRAGVRRVLRQPPPVIGALLLPPARGVLHVLVRLSLVLLVLVVLLPAARSASAEGAISAEIFGPSNGVVPSAEVYRPSGVSTSAVLLLSDRGKDPAEWKPLAVALAARGYHVIVPDLRVLLPGAPRRGREALRDEAELLVRGCDLLLKAVRGREPIERVLAGGAGVGAAAAVVLASRSVQPPAGLLLLSPSPDLGGVRVAQLLMELETPFLTVAARRDRAGAEAAHEIYLPPRPAGQLWELAGGERGAELIATHPRLVEDLTLWIEGILARRQPAVSQEPPPSRR